MRFTFSKKTQRRAASYSLTPNELAFIDLVACGWDLQDAYLLTMDEGYEWTANAIDTAARELKARLEAKKRVSDIRASFTPKETKTRSNDEDEDITKALSKEAMLRDLYLARKKMTPGSKDWLDTNKMIADITRMKQEEIKTEDNTVHFFLPLTCNKCSLYIASKQ